MSLSTQFLDLFGPKPILLPYSVTKEFLLPIFACISISHLPTFASMDHIMSHIPPPKTNVWTILFFQYIKVWDLRDYTCVQTLPVRFPLLSNARSPEYGPVCIYLQSNRALVACCGDYIGSIRLGAIQNRNPEMPVTHNAQLCCAMYNSFFRQVCLCVLSVLWDLKKKYLKYNMSQILAHYARQIYE